MKTISFLTLLLFFKGVVLGEVFNPSDQNLRIQQKDSLSIHPGIAVYPELVGKGFFSFNMDFPIKNNHRFSFGITWLDYSFEEHENYSVGGSGAPTAGLMYYYLKGKNNSYLELGGGFSLYHRLDLDYQEDSPLSLHGTISYRYQQKDGLLFRVGFTPFYRVNSWFLPLFGVSLGYSW